jgi:pimeloyl-ACP methyl ester carboxylesterase
MALWGELAVGLAREFSVIAFDPRGVGASSDAPWRHSTRDMARDAVALLDALGVARAHVFGLSLGGMVASWMASESGERVARLVLASTLPRAGALSLRRVTDLLGLAAAIARPGVEGEVALVRRVLSREFRRDHPARVAAIEREVRRVPSTRRNLVVLALAAARHDATAALLGLPVKALILVGRRDPIVGCVAERELLHDLPDARLVIVDGAGHDLSLEVPVDLSARILAFLGEP